MGSVRWRRETVAELDCKLAHCGGPRNGSSPMDAGVLDGEIKQLQGLRLKKLRHGAFVLLHLAIGSIGLSFNFTYHAEAITIVGSSAQARVQVELSDQARFIRDVQNYAQAKTLRIVTREVPAPWTMMEITIKTPQSNEIFVINATAKDKFSVTITVFDHNENWAKYWSNFRIYISTRYKWTDIR